MGVLLGWTPIIPTSTIAILSDTMKLWDSKESKQIRRSIVSARRFRRFVLIYDDAGLEEY
jgi:hypothetical protein